MIKNYLILSCILLVINSCNSIKIDFNNSNKRSYDVIEKEKKTLSILNIKTFETDTTLNFKMKDEIIEIFGEPDEDRIVAYNYPSPNILWILEGPLTDIKECTVLMMNWHYKNLKQIRTILFIRNGCQWVSITNVLYDDGLEF